MKDENDAAQAVKQIAQAYQQTAAQAADFVRTTSAATAAGTAYTTAKGYEDSAAILSTNAGTKVGEAGTSETEAQTMKTGIDNLITQV